MDGCDSFPSSLHVHEIRLKAAFVLEAPMPFFAILKAHTIIAQHLACESLLHYTSRPVATNMLALRCCVPARSDTCPSPSPTRLQIAFFNHSVRLRLRPQK